MSVDVNAVKVRVEGYFTSDDDWYVSRCAGHIEAVKCLINFHSQLVSHVLHQLIVHFQT